MQCTFRFQKDMCTMLIVLSLKKTDFISFYFMSNTNSQRLSSSNLLWALSITKIQSRNVPNIRPFELPIKQLSFLGKFQVYEKYSILISNQFWVLVIICLINKKVLEFPIISNINRWNFHKKQSLTSRNSFILKHILSLKLFISDLFFASFGIPQSCSYNCVRIFSINNYLL